MKQFKKMIHLVKNEGLVITKDMKGWDNHLVIKSVTELFLIAAQKCEPFVFIDNEDDDLVIYLDHEEVPIDPPFEVFSIEYNNNKAIAHSTEDDEIQIRTMALMLVETKTATYYFSLLQNPDDEDQIMVGCSNNPIYYTPLLKMMLDKINIGRVGVRPCREKVTIKGNGKKKYHLKKDREFIVVKSSAQRAVYDRDNRTGTRVDWSHSVSVRGHWRHFSEKENFIGLNRNGERIVKGKTWVKHCIKREELDPIKKTRVVK